MKPLYDVKSAARLLALSPWTVRSLIKRGRLKSVRIGRRVLLEEGELERLVSDAKALNQPEQNHGTEEVEELCPTK